MARLGLQQRGDTIIEVAIAIAVLSLVLAAAFVTSNKSQLSTQDTEERGNAIKLLETQVEALKVYSADSSGLAGHTDFCMQLNTGSAPTIVDNSATTTSLACTLWTNGLPVSANEEPAYAIRIVPETLAPGDVSGGLVYKITANWDNAAGTGTSASQLEYEVY